MADRAASPLSAFELDHRGGAPDADREPEPEPEQLSIRAKKFIVERLPEEWSFDGKRVLDFGCGAGGVLGQFRAEAEAPNAEFWGTELDARGMRRAARYLSHPFHVVQTYEAPPVPAPDGHFDLIYALSAFTRLTDEWSDWAAEMHRLLAPGGLLMFTFAGEGMGETLPGERWEEDRVGINFAGGPLTFMSEWWIRAHWGRAFDVLRLDRSAYEAGDLPGAYGSVLLSRREIVITPAEFSAVEPGEPREFLALRHNVAQLWRETANLRKQLYSIVKQNDDLVAGLRESGDRWRLTAEWWESEAARGMAFSRRLKHRVQWSRGASRLKALRQRFREWRG